MNKFWALFKLNLKIFIGQPIGLVIGGVAPIMILVVLPYLFNGIANIGATVHLKVTLEQLVPGLILIPTSIVGIVGIPVTLSTIKGANLLKKIKITNVSSVLFLSAFIFTFILIILVLTLFLFALAKAIWQDDAPNPSGGAFVIPWLLIMISCIVTGLFIGNLTSNNMTAFAIGMSMFLPTMFLTGVFFAQMQGWIEYFAKVVPQNHLVQLFKAAWFKNSLIVEPYQAGRGFNIAVNLMGKVPDTITAYVYPCGIFTLQTVFLALKFSWE